MQLRGVPLISIALIRRDSRPEVFVGFRHRLRVIIDEVTGRSQQIYRLRFAAIARYFGFYIEVEAVQQVCETLFVDRVVAFVELATRIPHVLPAHISYSLRYPQSRIGIVQ